MGKRAESVLHLCEIARIVVGRALRPCDESEKLVAKPLSIRGWKDSAQLFDHPFQGRHRTC